MSEDPQEARLDEERHSELLHAGDTMFFLWNGPVRLSYYAPISPSVACALRVSTPDGSSMWRSDNDAPGGWRHLAGLRRIPT